MTKVYLLGLPVLDEEHRELSRLLEELKRIVKVATIMDLATKVAELYIYAIHHLGSEERLMQSYGWVGVEEHKRKHALIRENLKDLYIRVEHNSEDLRGLANDMYLFVSGWLYTHILKEDKLFADYVLTINALKSTDT